MTTPQNRSYRIHVPTDFTVQPSRIRGGRKSAEMFLNKELLPCMRRMAVMNEGLLTIDFTNTENVPEDFIHDVFSPLKEEFGGRWLDNHVIIDANNKELEKAIWKEMRGLSGLSRDALQLNSMSTLQHEFIEGGDTHLADVLARRMKELQNKESHSL